MTITKEPSSIVSDTPRSARTSFGVPAKNVLRNSRSCSTASHFLHQRRQQERAEDEDGGDELEIVRIEAPAQREGDDQAEEHRAEDSAEERGADAVRAEVGARDDHAR